MMLLKMLHTPATHETLSNRAPLILIRQNQIITKKSPPIPNPFVSAIYCTYLFSIKQLIRSRFMRLPHSKCAIRAVSFKDVALHLAGD